MTVQNDLLTGLARGAAAGDPRELDALLAELEPLVVRTARLSRPLDREPAGARRGAGLGAADRSRPRPEARPPGAPPAPPALAARRRGAPSRPHREPDERPRALKEEFDRLPPRQCATAVLRLYAGLSEEETALALGCSLGAVKSNSHNARKRLTERLRERGLPPLTLPARTQEVPR